MFHVQTYKGLRPSMNYGWTIFSCGFFSDSSISQHSPGNIEMISWVLPPGHTFKPSSILIHISMKHFLPLHPEPQQIMDLHQNDRNMFENLKTKWRFVALIPMEVCSKCDRSCRHKPFILLLPLPPLLLLREGQTLGNLVGDPSLSGVRS